MGLLGSAAEAAPDVVRAWRPGIAGVAEVLHAAWHEHAYPAHTHDTWTVLVVDSGLIGYGLDGHEHAAQHTGVTVLPPGVVHDGRSVTAAGFRKRVVYLEPAVLDDGLVGRAVDAPLVLDDALRARFVGLDRALTVREDLAAESLLALVTEGLAWHLSGRPTPPREPATASTARRARDLLDTDPAQPVRLAEVAAELDVTVPHLVRAFTREVGLPPHQYLVGRRLDLARRRLLAGEPAADVATATGFHDQSHLTRHFRRLLRTTPTRYQRGSLLFEA
ncbi:transcriptional regulator, AraC family [Promicromonospora umidemergens]|uniref:AraC family transcriptional regulator n=1 Tax=Promicromonospora umidemergens TaxID=629679 RepID=A0ABP8X0T1_9MICO|nr:AraC family transcriptional regulator [Promicromonospora umidemergens]MCP2286688.1 transcriptional regulator, AraC family [Promicromonospora umidemergens]